MKKSILYGDLTNLKTSLVQRLEQIYTYLVPREQFSTPELDEELLDLTQQMGREIAVYLNGNGRVMAVSIGDHATVDLPEVGTRRLQGLSGIRCLHTHPGGDSTLSEPDISSLCRLSFDFMGAISKTDKGEIFGTVGFLTGDFQEDGTPDVTVVGPCRERDLLRIDMKRLLASIQKKLLKHIERRTGKKKETALLAGVEIESHAAVLSIEDSMAELQRLADTAGAAVIGMCIQRRGKPDAAFFLGRGKVEELSLAIQQTGATMVIFDDELTPSQQRNLTLALGSKVIDRTALILDIFAQRARTKEGKLQVELAQLRYHLPRLGGQGLFMSRLGGGIGARGPGESKLELDRRRIRKRIHVLETQIQTISKHRCLHREQRKAAAVPLVAMVGYTNAGKTSLLNAFTGAAAFAEDKLFATLDPLTRRITLKSGQDILLTDTVGFIQKLPHTLVPAFQATLEEVREADLLLHVVDASSQQYEEQIEAVVRVLREIQVERKPTLYVFNKVDLCVDHLREQVLLRDRDGILLSARTGENLTILADRLDAFFSERRKMLQLLLPFEKGRLLALLHEKKAIVSQEFLAYGIRVTANVPQNLLHLFSEYVIADQ